MGLDNSSRVASLDQVVTALIPRLVLGIGQSCFAYEIESASVTSHNTPRRLGLRYLANHYAAVEA